MSNDEQYVVKPKELLTYIIKLAKKEGFKFKNFLDHYDSFTITSFNVETGRLVFVFRNEEELRVVYDSIYILFFDITFATALFGEDWEIHLNKLAQSKDKLKYVADHLLIPIRYETENKNYQARDAAC